MPRIIRPTGRQIALIGRQRREGPGDPILKRTLVPNSSSGLGPGGVCCSPASASNERWFGFEEQSNITAITKTAVVMGATTTTAGGGTAAFVDATGSYIAYTSGTALGAVGGLSAAATNEFQTRLLPDLQIVMKTGGVAADIADLRIWIGAHNDGAIGTDTPGTSGIDGLVFRYSTPAGDTNWMAGSFDGASQTFTDTGIAVAVDTRYVMRIKVVSTSSVEYYINGTLVATLTTTLPASTTSIDFGYCHTVNAVAGTARTIRWRKTFCEML